MLGRSRGTGGEQGDNAKQGTMKVKLVSECQAVKKLRTLFLNIGSHAFAPNVFVRLDFKH